MGVIQFKGGSIQFKGGTIQFKNLGKVANPTITAYWGGESGNWLYRVTVTNNDTETATIYADRGPNMHSYGDLAGGATTTITIGTTPLQPPAGTAFRGYVQMKAAGRTNSDIVSDVSNGFDTGTEYAGFNNIVPLYRTTDPFDIPANDNTEFTLTNDHPSVGQVVVFTKNGSLDSAINIGTYPFAPDEAETYVVARVICEKLNTQSQLEIELYYRWENEDYPKTKIYADREDYESTIVSFLGQEPNGAFELRAKHNYGGLENGYVISDIYSYNIDLMDQTINAPLFDKPFNQLTRNERKQQLDAWYFSDANKTKLN